MSRNQDNPSFQVVLLAGDRGPGDPVARSQGTSCKALSRIQGRELVLRVLEMLLDSPVVEHVHVVGPVEGVLHECPALLALLKRADVTWVAPGSTPCTSALKALEQISDDKSVVITTADLGFPETRVFETFCRDAHGHKADAVAGLAHYDTVQTAFPGTRRTAIKLRGSAWCGCNLFALNNALGRRAVAYWRRVEKLRKKPWKIAGVLGWRFLLGFLFRRRTLRDAMESLSSGIGAEVDVVEVAHPAAAIDIDRPEDVAFVEKHLAGRNA